MKIMGLVLRRGNVFYAVLDGETQNVCRIVKVSRVPSKRTTSIAALMDWYDTAFRELIDDYAPDIIVHESGANLSAQEAAYELFPLGVLNLICYRHQILVKSRPQDYVTSVRKRKCKAYFDDMELQLIDPELDAVILAWHEL